VLANPGSGVAGRALARYLRETGGREALFRLALSEAPGYEDDIERALATGSSAVHFFSYGCVWGGPRSMDDATARAMLRWLAKLDEGELRLPEYPLLRFRFGSTLDPENMKGLCSIENLGEPTGIGEVDDEGDEAALRDDDVERLLEEIAAQVDDGASG
jgi:hypothetical protein